MPIDLPVHYPTCSFWLFHSDKLFVLTCPLTCCSKYLQMYPFINQPVPFVCVFHLALQAHLSVISSAGLHTDRPTRKWMYLLILMLLAITPADSTVYMSIDAPVQKLSPFIFMHPFRFTSTIYPFTQLLFCIYTDIPGNKSTSLSWYFPSG